MFATVLQVFEPLGVLAFVREVVDVIAWIK
jgi:hypothetical protein